MTYDLYEFCWIEFKINDFILSFSRSLYLELLRVVAMSKWCVCCLLYFHLKVMNGFRVELHKDIEEVELNSEQSSELPLCMHF